MNGNPKNTPYREKADSQKPIKDSVFYCLDQLRTLATKYPTLLGLIDEIGKKLEKLPTSVQSLGVTLMTQQIDSLKAGNVSMDAALRAIDIHADGAANDESYEVQKAA
jgi:hypothetical protein